MDFSIASILALDGLTNGAIYALLGLLSDAVVRRVEAHVLSYRRSLGS